MPLWDRARYYELVKQGKPVFAVRGIVEQAAKAVIDIVAVKSGLNYHLLRHRAKPTMEAERREWEHIWAVLTAPGANAA